MRRAAGRAMAITAGLGAAGALAMTGPAAAATLVGRDYQPPANRQCSTNLLTMYPPAGPSEYGISVTGVLTSWKLGAATVADNFTFKVGRGDTNILTVAETPGTVEGGAIRASARIPVRAGDRIGYYGDTAASSCGPDDPGAGFASGDVPAGSSATFFQSSWPRLSLSAIVEPDADGDGYGDESQDLCPTDASTQAACPPRPAPPAAETPAPTAPQRDTVAPVISHPSLSSPVFAVDSRASAAASAKGTSLSLTLSEPATVVFVTEQRARGRWRKLRIFGKRLPAGTSTVAYSGRIKPRGRTRSLLPGRYRIRMRPSDHAGNRGAVTAMGFRVVR